MNTLQIWNKFQSKLLAYINKRVNNQDDALDILQTIFEKIQNNQNLDTISSISGWVFQITKNQIIDYYRQNKDHQSIPDDLQAKVSEKSDKELEFFNQCLVVFTNDFNPDEQIIFQESIINQKSLRHIAQEMGASYSTIKSKSRRSKEKFRKRFKGCCNITSIDSLNIDTNINCDKCCKQW